MRKITITYEPRVAQILSEGVVPKNLATMIAVPNRVQAMCIGQGQRWNEECPKYLRYVLNKEKLVRAFSESVKLHINISVLPLGLTTATLRFFQNENSEESSYDVTINLNPAGSASIGYVKTMEQLYAATMKH